jgi:hypothetical protein
MLEFKQLGDSSIKVFVANETPEQKVGSITDQCCYTLIYLHKVPHPIKIKYEVNKGGYLSKNKDGTPLYREKMIEIFHYLYESEALRILLRKKVIELNRNHIEEGTYLSILQRYEKEIKL